MIWIFVALSSAPREENRCCYHRRMNERQWRMRPSASSSGRRRAAREEEDAHLWASDATLFARTIEAGPDLYASDAALFSGDARNHGADLWASDAALFATSEDRASARASGPEAVAGRASLLGGPETERGRTRARLRGVSRGDGRYRRRARCRRRKRARPAVGRVGLRPRLPPAVHAGGARRAVGDTPCAPPAEGRCGESASRYKYVVPSANESILLTRIG